MPAQPLDPTRAQILAAFARAPKTSFSDLARATGLPSNLLAHHLRRLSRDGLLANRNRQWRLTSAGESLLPRLAHQTGEEKPPLCVVLSVIKDGSRVLLLRRAKQPFLGYWGFPGGKMKAGESVLDAAVREAREETGLDVASARSLAVVHERVREQGQPGFKHAWILFLVEVTPGHTRVRESEEGRVAWFDLAKISRARIIPSDAAMIRRYLRGAHGPGLAEVVMTEKNGRLLRATWT